MLALAITLPATMGKIVFYGACLSMGFWAGKKITNKADEYLILWDKNLMASLKEEANGYH